MKANGVPFRLSLGNHSLLRLLSILLVAIIISPVSAMHRADSSRYFLFIEPEAAKKESQPVQDEYTQSLQDALKQAKKGTSDYSNLKSKGDFRDYGGYRGMHFGEDGEVSDTVDYLLPNGLITNSLCLHYAKWYRRSLPPTELKKLHDLHAFMQKQQQKDL